MSGRVQGVGFRAATQKTARRLGVNGSVRNLPDGGVEIVAEAEPQALDAFIDWCRLGPAHAWVAKIQIDERAAEGRMRGFDVIR